MNMITQERPVSALPKVLTAPATPTVAARPVTAMPSEVLSFRLGGEEYGVDMV